VLAEHAGERGRHGERAATGLRLGWSGNVPATGAARDLLGDEERRSQEVDATDAQSCALAPAKAEYRAEVRHRGVVGPELFCQALEVDARYDRAGYLFDLGELDAAARRTADVVTLDGEMEHGASDAVRPTDGPGLVSLAPSVDKLLDVARCDRAQRTRAECRLQVESNDAFISCECARPFPRVAREPLAGHIGERRLGSARVEPRAAAAVGARVLRRPRRHAACGSCVCTRCRRLCADARRTRSRDWLRVD